MKTTAASIIAEHADRYGVTLAEFLDGTNKARALAHARQDAMAEVRRRTSLSLPQIGRAFGMDHTNILHGIRASEARSKGDVA